MSRSPNTGSPSSKEVIRHDEQSVAWVKRYLPRASLLASLKRARERHLAISPRAEEVREAAILIADVSGFSAAEAAEERRAGLSGVDRFSETVNAVLGRGTAFFFFFFFLKLDQPFDTLFTGSLCIIWHAGGRQNPRRVLYASSHRQYSRSLRATPVSRSHCFPSPRSPPGANDR